MEWLSFIREEIVIATFIEDKIDDRKSLNYFNNLKRIHSIKY